jgi:hypothetical protein
VSWRSRTPRGRRGTLSGVRLTPEVLARQYEAERSVIEPDVIAMLDGLLVKRVLETVPADGADAAGAVDEAEHCHGVRVEVEGALGRQQDVGTVPAA